MSTERPAELDVSVLPPEHRPAVIFAHTLFTSTPRVWVTYALVAASIGIFVAMAVRGVSVLQPRVDDLIAWGANYPPRTGRGEWWRLVTCMFLHGGLVHLGINMWVLYDAGPLVERLFGNVGFFLLYVLSGVFGSLASYVFSGVTSVGASGAIFGIIGGLLAFTVGQRDAVPSQILGGFRRSAITFTLINGAIGFVIPHVDVAGHIGGFVGGVVCGLLLRQRFSPDVVRTRWLRNLICGVVVPAGLLAVWPLLPPPPPDLIVEPARIDASRLAASAAFNAVVDKLQKKAITYAAAADQLERDSLPHIRDARNRLNGLDRWVAGGGMDLKALKEHFRLFEEAIELHIRGFREKNQALIRKGQRRLEESNATLAPLVH